MQKSVLRIHKVYYKKGTCTGASQDDAASAASDDEGSVAESVDNKKSERIDSADEGDDEREQDIEENEVESPHESKVEVVEAGEAYQDDGEIKMLGYRLKGEASIRHPKGFTRYARRYRGSQKRALCEVSSDSDISEITSEQFNKRLKTSQGQNVRCRTELNTLLTSTSNKQPTRLLPSSAPPSAASSNAAPLVPTAGYCLNMYLEGYGSDAEFLTG
ncbi:hypothetical protein VNI00_016117 [Paramarasmius palmivorus]|uniref:Uncharacterized protein n=1 Tax=Paramarasmius palmivorus TaxID=297713 RepID=A0AAW0BGD3_9AGAR